MDNNSYFMHRIKHSTSGWDKGIEVKADEGADNFSAAKQSYHAYLGAYAYGHDSSTDYVYCEITDIWGNRKMDEAWVRPDEEPQPEE